MTDSRETAICTWFVSDAEADATFFPQVGSVSNAPDAQAIYWRCIACFFASSVALNHSRRHIFFTNTSLPVIDGVAIADLFVEWDVEIVTLPITYRLSRGEVKSWGNQFYILDVIAWIAHRGESSRWLVLDSDCVWIKPVDAIERAIDEHKLLTYELDYSHYAINTPINGLARDGMARFLAEQGGVVRPYLAYYGGEIFAARVEEVRRLAEGVPALWKATQAGHVDAPREEAHFLSILYAANGYADGTANRFIRRIWTAIKHYNARESDRELTIWHVPAAKRFGFKALYHRLCVSGSKISDPASLGFNQASYERELGVPRATKRLLARIFVQKVRELGARLASRRGK